MARRDRPSVHHGIHPGQRQPLLPGINQPVVLHMDIVGHSGAVSFQHIPYFRSVCFPDILVVTGTDDILLQGPDEPERSVGRVVGFFVFNPEIGE